MRILVADSSRANLLILTRQLERCGAKVLPAEYGETAVETFVRERPDLVLLDTQLTDIGGFVVAQRIRALENPDDWTPIIFLSSTGSDDDIEHCIQAGGDDYLVSPVREAMLNAKIRAMQRIIQMRTSLVVLARKLDTANRELLHLSASDGLTGIANRRFFDEHIARELRRARRSGECLSLVMCDIDHFKLFNDTYGHQAGDDCLRRVAATLAGQVERASDVAARYGGEEFAVVLSNTGEEGARVVAERVRQALRMADIPHAASPHGRVTVSIGIATSTPDVDNASEHLIKSADYALYQAKHQGRDRICLAGAITSD